MDNESFATDPRRRNPLRPPGPVRLHLNEPAAHTLDPLSTYPDSAALTEALAQIHDVSPASVLVTAGADAAIEAACRSTAGRAVLLDPDFPRYRDHAQNAGLDIILVPISDNGESFPGDQVLAAATGGQGVVIASTVGNPTGYRPSTDFFRRLHDEAPHALVVIDEVYSDFVGVDHSRFAADIPNVLSVRSMSKVGFPGLRVGYVIGHRDTLSSLRRFVSPFSVSALSLDAALTLTSDTEAWTRNIRRQSDARAWLAEELVARGFQIASPGANWVLVRFGPGARAVVRELARRGIRIQAPGHTDLAEWARISSPDLKSLAEFVAALDETLASPVEDIGGHFVVRHGYRNSSAWARAPFVMRIDSEVVEVDHFVVTLEDADEHSTYVDTMLSTGAVLVEGPGVWPSDFCAELDGFPIDLSMRFATVRIPDSGLVVVAAPHQRGDQLDRFRGTRGPWGVHHIAINVPDVLTAGGVWARRGWSPLSVRPIADGDLIQWFLANNAGQIVELIGRPRGGHKTFTCRNIAGLRRSERS